MSSGFDMAEASRRFPSYFSDTDKGRLQGALSNFSSVSALDSNGATSKKTLSLVESQRLYAHFYLRSGQLPDYLLQADIVDSIRQPVWITDKRDPAYASYSKEYIRALLISNTCDVDVSDKSRDVPKEVAFVPVVPIRDYVASLMGDPRVSNKVETIILDVKNQKYSNLFYLPSTRGFEEHVALLDQPFWFPADELRTIFAGVLESRVVSLSQWAYYLFIMKLSYHLCRLPEAADRPSA
jgi:hypothetical protein